MESSSRLCDLISSHLHPYLDLQSDCLTLETERDVLLSLSLVHRELQQWTIDSSSNPENCNGLYTNHCCHESSHHRIGGEHMCLYNIISATVAFLNADSQFVGHAAGKVLLSISNFLIKQECLWTKFLQLIWFILEASMTTVFSYQELLASAVIHVDTRLMLFEPNSVNIAKGQDLDFARFIALVKTRLANVNQFLVVRLFQTLRNILKSLKSEPDDLEDIFIQYAVSSLIKMPWDLLVEVFNCRHSSQISFHQVDEIYIRTLTKMKNILFGTVLQLCCSIVGVLDFDAIAPLKEFSFYSKFSDLVIPKLLSCCFINKLENSRDLLFNYLIHKSLIMMIRLSFQCHWNNFHSESCLKLLNQHFEEIFLQSFLRCDTGSENCLEDSPFCANSLEGGGFYPRHLQRKAIFILFKCSFTIACVGQASMECVCNEEATSSSLGLQFCRKHCQNTLLETFYRTSCLLEKFQDCRNYSESCSKYAICFLQLYMEEDDMLFKILLLLLSAPFSQWPKENSKTNPSVGANKDMLRNFKSIFCPIRLFHLFIFLLHYDHLVIVDYLISKDTGIHCLEYLLRCLRLIHESWPAFKHFSIFGKGNNCRYKKRRKFSLEEDGNPKFLSSTSSFGGEITRQTNFFLAYEINSHTFENARLCLHSLYISLGELQRKSLFPYNAKPLLKRLARFLELCETNDFHQI